MTTTVAAAIYIFIFIHGQELALQFHCFSSLF